MNEKEFIKEHPSLDSGRICSVAQLIRQDITNVIGETCNGYKDDTKFWKSEDFDKLQFVLKEVVHKTQLDKQKVKDVINIQLKTKFTKAERIESIGQMLKQGYPKEAAEVLFNYLSRLIKFTKKQLKKELGLK